MAVSTNVVAAKQLKTNGGAAAGFVQPLPSSDDLQMALELKRAGLGHLELELELKMRRMNGRQQHRACVGGDSGAKACLVTGKASDRGGLVSRKDSVEGGSCTKACLATGESSAGGGVVPSEDGGSGSKGERW